MSDKHLKIALEQVEKLDLEIKKLKKLNKRLKSQLTINQTTSLSDELSIKVNLDKIFLERNKSLAKMAERNLSEG